MYHQINNKLNKQSSALTIFKMKGMKLTRLKRNINILKKIKKASAKKRRSLIKTASSDVIKTLSECCRNVLNGNCKIRPKLRNKLRRYKEAIREIGCYRAPLKRKRALLSQQGGFLSGLLGALLPIVGSGIASLIKK
jgi:hypothetical protein